VVEGEAVLEVFRIEGGATVGVGGGDDGAVPMREAVAPPQCGGVKNECVAEGLERQIRREVEKFIDLSLIDAEAGLAQGVGNELLKNLGGDDRLAGAEELDRDAAFHGVKGVQRVGVEEDVAIEKRALNHDGRIVPPG